MWIAEFRVWHESSEVLALTRKYDVTVLSLYLNVYKERGKTIISKALAVNGPDANAYIAEVLKTMRRYRILHAERNYIFFSVPHDALSYHTLILGEGLFFIKPFFLKEGREYWTVASWEKKAILGLYKRVARNSEKASIELVSLRQEDVDLFIPDVLQRLSDQQFSALRRAADLGYYGYPRSINLKALAKKAGKSPSALRELLRTAESKLVPVAVRQFQRA